MVHSLTTAPFSRCRRLLVPLPGYFLPRPPLTLTPAITNEFDALFADSTLHGSNTSISYSMPIPKWQFLCYLTDTKNILLHGSGQSDITQFEPRQSIDVTEFGNQRAVYAAADGIWPMFFAIVDREQHVTSLLNACIRLVNSDGQLTEPSYFFSINGDALPFEPWRTGTIYILPRDTFEPQPRQHYRGLTIDIAQWASYVAVRPLASLTVEPADFPFLADILPHDPKMIRERAAQDPSAFPWMDEELR